MFYEAVYTLNVPVSEGHDGAIYERPYLILIIGYGYENALRVAQAHTPLSPSGQSCQLPIRLESLLPTTYKNKGE